MKRVVEFSDSVEADMLFMDINAINTKAHSVLNVIAYASARADNNTTCK